MTAAVLPPGCPRDSKLFRDTALRRDKFVHGGVLRMRGEVRGVGDVSWVWPLGGRGGLKGTDRRRYLRGRIHHRISSRNSCARLVSGSRSR